MTPAGFRQDGTEAFEAVHEAMERALYRRADPHLPPGTCGSVPAPDSEAEGAQDGAD